MIKKQSTVSVAVFDNDMLIVNCGRFIKFGKIEETMFA